MRHSVGGRESLDGLERGLEDEIAGFVTATMGESSAELKQAWRDQVVAVGLGQRLANSIRSEVYPQAPRKSVNAAAMVFTNAPEIIDGFARGATIQPVNGARYLAIPTDLVGRLVNVEGKRRKITPALFQQKTGLRLRMVVRSNGNRLLIVEGGRITKAGRIAPNRGRTRSGYAYSRLTGGVSAVAFILVPAVKLPKLQDLDSLAAAADGRFDGLLSKNWR
jgi:hypothetical protein